MAKLLQNESKLNVQKSWAFAAGPVELNLSLMRVNLGATHILNLCRSIELYKMKLVRTSIIHLTNKLDLLSTLTTFRMYILVMA